MKARIARSFVFAFMLALTGLGARTSLAVDARSAPVMGEDGLYTQSWFLQSFLDLKEDLAEAAQEGKRFAVIWEQKGCPYCRETHVVNFAVPEIQKFVKENFVVLQLNLRGSRKVTDFDGETLTERDLARKHGVTFTPTVCFYPETVAKLKGKKGRALEKIRMTGYYRPFHFLMAFRYVSEKGYDGHKFRDYIKVQTETREKEGKPVSFR